MSLAGVLSSRGDGYQTLIAIEWAVKMLADESISAIEVNSTSLDPSENPVAIDDVVVRFRDGRSVYCQCKKNQKDFEDWKLSELRGELVKAGNQLARDMAGEVRFYSANNFGLVAKLRERAVNFSDEKAYRESVGGDKGLTPADQDLQKLWSQQLAACGKDVFHFLRRISLITTSPVDTLKSDRIDRLRDRVTQPDLAYALISQRLDEIDRRLGADGQVDERWRMTRGDLITLLEDSGCLQTPPVAESELLDEFARTSQIGRDWRRGIGGRKIPRRALEEIQRLVAEESKSILIKDGPGAGKTCLLLDLADHLASESTCAILFIQGREFSQADDRDRIAQGLPPDLVGRVARMAEYRHVVVILDSLDVLSLARDHKALKFFLGVVDRLRVVPNVTIVAACRGFDVQYHRLLSVRTWQSTVEIGPLDFDGEVVLVLTDLGINPDSLSPQLKDLLTNPRQLALFEEIAKRGEVPHESTAQELSARYLDTVVLRNPELGEAALTYIEKMAATMLTDRKLDVSRVRVGLPEEICSRLLSEGVIRETDRRTLTFDHQTLFDVLSVAWAERNGQTLLDFIGSLRATPFVRPAIRAFFFYLRQHNPAAFRQQVRAALDASTVPYHVKRLLCESLAEIDPADDDRRLIRHLFSSDVGLFNAFYSRSRKLAWLDFFEVNWLPVLRNNGHQNWLLAHARHVAIWAGEEPNNVIAYWMSVLADGSIDSSLASREIVLSLHNFKEWRIDALYGLFESLVAIPRQKPDFLGHALAKWVTASDSGDDLLWKYMTAEIDADALREYRLGRKLRCGLSDFHSKSFLNQRLCKSERLLNVAIAAVEAWSAEMPGSSSGKGEWQSHFVDNTSYAASHRRFMDGQAEVREADDLLLSGVESACIEHAGRNSDWWQQNCSRLVSSCEGAFRFIAMKACARYPDGNLREIEVLLTDESILTGFPSEAGNLLNASFHLLNEQVQDGVFNFIERLSAEKVGATGTVPTHVLCRCRDLIASIPTFLRPPGLQRFLEDVRRQFPDGEREPRLEMLGGWVAPPVSWETLNGFSDHCLVDLLNHFENVQERWAEYPPLGGKRDVARQLTEAASRDPLRFLNLLSMHWTVLDSEFRDGIVEGAASHLHYRFGRTQNQGWSALRTPGGIEVAAPLLTLLERYPSYWTGRREMASALQGCAFVVESDEDMERIGFLLFDLLHADSPGGGSDTRDDLISTAINSTRGIAAGAACILTVKQAERGGHVSPLLAGVLLRFASDPHPAVRAEITRQLPVLQHHQSELGWRVFGLATSGRDVGVWRLSKMCLYYAYHRHFEIVAPHLDTLATLSDEKCLKIWGQISALASLSEHATHAQLIDALSLNASKDSWEGAAKIFSANLHLAKHRDACISGLLLALDDDSANILAGKQMQRMFRETEALPRPSNELLRKYFAVMANDESLQHDLHSYIEWLVRLFDESPAGAIEALEIMLAGIESWPFEIYDQGESAKLLNELFREAEEREESDGGSFLLRVIAAQDALLKRGVYQLDEWLRDAERM